MYLGYRDGRPAQEIFRTDELLVEAPNWNGATSELILNADGHFYRLPVSGGHGLSRIDVPGLPAVNNDHVLATDFSYLLTSTVDGQVYQAPLNGTSATRLSPDRTEEDALVLRYLHGVSPDGRTIAYTGIRYGRRPSPETLESPGPLDIFTMPRDGGEHRQLTFGPGNSDGSEFSPDGEIYFNTEMFTNRSGHAQIARMRADGGNVERLTFDDAVNWFPHVSPAGDAAVYLAYLPGTLGHPANEWVEIKIVEGDWRSPRLVSRFFGGQGSMNVNSWSPDSQRFAYVAYPIEGQVDA
ncbi:TolB family protein [Streptodolium elevatio]